MLGEGNVARSVFLAAYSLRWVVNVMETLLVFGWLGVFFFFFNFFARSLHRLSSAQGGVLEVWAAGVFSAGWGSEFWYGSCLNWV